MKNFFKILLLINFFFIVSSTSNAAEKVEYLKTDWSFKGLFGKFDRGSLQRGYQVYTEVCAACHSMKYVSYRNLAEKGGPEFSVEQAKQGYAWASSYNWAINQVPSADDISVSVTINESLHVIPLFSTVSNNS